MIRSQIRPAIVAAGGAALLSATVACSSGAATAAQPAGDHDAFVQSMTDNGVPAPPGVDRVDRLREAQMGRPRLHRPGWISRRGTKPRRSAHPWPPRLLPGR